MNLESLQYFMDIASGQTFFSVAEKYNTSQSSVSKAIIRLEDELSVKLFDRSKRVVHLTHSGEIFYNGLKKLYPAYQNLLNETMALSNTTQYNCIFLSTSHMYGLDIYLEAIKINDGKQSAVLNISSDSNLSQSIVALENNDISFLMSHRYPPLDRPTLHETFLLEDPIIVVFPDDFPPFEGKTSLSFSDIYYESIMLSSSNMIKALQFLCETYDVSVPVNAIFYPTSAMRMTHLLDRVAAGFGITLMFKSQAYKYNLQHFGVLPLKTEMSFPLAVYTSKNTEKNDPLIELFLEKIKAKAREATELRKAT